MNKLFKNTDKKTRLLFLSLSLLMVVCALVQNSVGVLFAPSNFRLYILVTITVAVAMITDEIPALLFGFTGGLLADIYAPNHLGFNCIILMLVALCVSLLISHFLRSTVLNYMIISGIMLFAYILLYWLIFVAFAGVDGALSALFKIYLPNCIATYFIGIGIFFIVRYLKKAFNIKAVL